MWRRRKKKYIFHLRIFLRKRAAEGGERERVKLSQPRREFNKMQIITSHQWLICCCYSEYSQFPPSTLGWFGEKKGNEEVQACMKPLSPPLWSQHETFLHWLLLLSCLGYGEVFCVMLMLKLHRHSSLCGVVGESERWWQRDCSLPPKSHLVWCRLESWKQLPTFILMYFSPVLASLLLNHEENQPPSNHCADKWKVNICGERASVPTSPRQDVKYDFFLYIISTFMAALVPSQQLSHTPSLSHHLRWLKAIFSIP